MFHKVQVPAGIGLLQNQMLQLILEMEQVRWSRKIADRQLFKLRWKTNWRDQSNQLQDENGDDDDYDGGDDDDNENGSMMKVMMMTVMTKTSSDDDDDDVSVIRIINCQMILESAFMTRWALFLLLVQL